MAYTDQVITCADCGIDFVFSASEQAFFAGDRESYQWWLGVCRTLDKRLAARLEHKAVTCNGPLL